MRNKILKALQKDFNFSYQTAVNWVNAHNLNFGGSTPDQLIKANRGDKVLFWIKSIKQKEDSK